MPSNLNFFGPTPLPLPLPLPSPPPLSRLLLFLSTVSLLEEVSEKGEKEEDKEERRLEGRGVIEEEEEEEEEEEGGGRGGLQGKIYPLVMPLGKCLYWRREGKRERG